jgi:methyl-accepting chemotaxis protein
VRHVLARMVLLELSFVPVALLVWWLSDTLDVRVLALFIVLRIPVATLHLRALLLPVRRWQQLGERADERQLLAADGALQRLYSRYAPAYSAGWFVAHLLALLCARLGVPEYVPLAHGELLTVGLLILVGSAVHPALIFPVLRHLTDAPMVELGRELARRGSSPPRPPSSFLRELRRVLLTLIFAAITALGAVGSQIRIEGIRAQALGEQHERSELAAEHLRAGLPIEDEELEIVAEPQLPGVLARLARPGMEVLGAFDYEHEEVVAAAAVGDGRWVLARAKPNEQLGATVLVLALLEVSLLSLCALTLSLSISVLMKRLRELDDSTRRMAETGELGALARVVPIRADELGSLVANFNAMLDMLAELVHAAEAVAGGDLRVELEHPGDLHDAFRTMIRELHGMVEQLRETAVEVSSASAEIHASMQVQERASIQQAQDVERASETARSLAQAAGGISEAAASVLSFAEQSLATNDAMVERIGELNEQARGIGELLELIREVASRSDLLALNGSLEATRAGAAGRGFALVAVEMRRLAERVTGAVEDVRERVTGIESTGNATVMATERSRKLAEDTAEAVREISTLTRKQSEDTRRASSSAEAMAELVSAASAGTSQTRDTAAGLHRQATELERLTGRFRLRDSPEEEDSRRPPD